MEQLGWMVIGLWAVAGMSGLCGITARFPLSPGRLPSPRPGHQPPMHRYTRARRLSGAGNRKEKETTSAVCAPLAFEPLLAYFVRWM